MLHDLVKCRRYRLREDAKGYEHVQPEYPGHGSASVMIATVDQFSPPPSNFSVYASMRGDIRGDVV